MRIIAFITESVDGRAILEHIGEPVTPPRIARARGSPEGYDGSAADAIAAEACLPGDSLAQPELGGKGYFDIGGWISYPFRQKLKQAW